MTANQLYEGKTMVRDDDTTPQPIKQNAGASSGVKDEGKPTPPRRPLSAYNYYFRYERATILGTCPLGGDEDESSTDSSSKGPTTGKKKRKHKKTHGKIGFKELVRHVSKKWKEIDHEERAYFQALADEEKKLYRLKVREYKKKLRRWSEEKYLNTTIKFPTGAEAAEDIINRNNYAAVVDDLSFYPFQSFHPVDHDEVDATTSLEGMMMAKNKDDDDHTGMIRSDFDLEPTAFDDDTAPPPITDIDMKSLQCILGDNVVEYLATLD